jgi:hypothetical protein
MEYQLRKALGMLKIPNRIRKPGKSLYAKSN